MARPLTIRESLPHVPRIWRQFWPYIRKRRLLLGGSLAALLAQACLQVLEPWPLKFVFDRVVAPSPRGSGSTLVDALDPLVVLTLAALGLVAITGLRALASYLGTVGFALAGNRVLADVRAALYRHLQYLSLSFHAREKSGELALRVMSDVSIINDVAVTAAPQLATTILVLVGMVALMLWMQWQLALLALALAPLFWLRTTRLSKRIQEVSRTQRQRDGALAATTVESIGAIKVVQALSLEGVFASTFSSANEKSLREGVRASRLAASLERSVDLLIAVDTALVLWFGARLVLQHALTAGELLVFLSYLKSAFRPMRDFARYAGRLAKATAAGDRVIEVFEQVPDVRTMPGAIPAPKLSGALRFDGVTFAYAPGREALADVSFEARPGQRIAITGPSGSGKSTLASLLLRLYDPQRGAVMLDGADVRVYELDSLRAQISVVLQDTVLFAASMRDNIAYGAPQATEAEIEAAARLANAHQFIQALPQGYDTIIGERGATLSGGQRQRISLARAAVRRAAILILDEPTVSLDEENARAVADAIWPIAAGRTTLLISHDLALVAQADLILYLEGGRIAERGTCAELMRANGPYAHAYRLHTLRGRRVASAALECPFPRGPSSWPSVLARLVRPSPSVPRGQAPLPTRTGMPTCWRGMRILYVCSDLGIPVLGQRGGSIHVRSLVTALERAGHSVALAAPLLTKSVWEPAASLDGAVLHVPPSRETVAASRSFARFETTVAGAASALSGELRRILYHDDLASALLDAYRESPPDVVYERYALYGTAGAAAARAFGVPLLLEVNAPLALEDREYRGGGGLGSLADAAERWTISRADGVIVVSDALREHVVALGVPPERIHVIPNGVDPALFRPAPRAPEVRARWGLDGGPLIGFVGGYQPWHGVSVLPSLLQRLLSRHPSLRLVVVGDGRGRDEFERELEARGVAAHAVLTGAVRHEEVPALIREFDVALAPYPRPRHDFYFSPLKIFEYMACGVGVVAPRLGQIEEVVRNGETGLLYSPSELDELEAACERLLSDRELAHRIGRAAAEDAHRNHTWERNAARVTRIAEALLAERVATR